MFQTRNPPSRLYAVHVVADRVEKMSRVGFRYSAWRVRVAKANTTRSVNGTRRFHSLVCAPVHSAWLSNNKWNNQMAASWAKSIYFCERKCEIITLSFAAGQTPSPAVKRRNRSRVLCVSCACVGVCVCPRYEVTAGDQRRYRGSLYYYDGVWLSPTARSHWGHMCVSATVVVVAFVVVPLCATVLYCTV